MLAELFATIQASDISAALRGSHRLKDVIEIGHLVGLALLFGAIAPLDLRLLGVWRSLTIADLSKALIPVATFGLILAMVTGALLFTTEATKLGYSDLFRLKLVLVGLGIANALLLRMARVWITRSQTAYVRGEPRLKIAGGISLLVWLSAIVIGQML